MRMFLWTIAILMFGTSSSFAQPSPSFDCSKAATEVEKLICSDEELAKLDVEMNDWYKKVIRWQAIIANQDTSGTKESQARWINRRNNFDCKSNISNKKECLISLHEEAIQVYKNTLLRYELYRACNWSGDKPLSRKCDFSYVESLLKKGADLKGYSEFYGQCWIGPVYFTAFSTSKKEIVDYVIKQNIKFDDKVRDDCVYTQVLDTVGAFDFFDEIITLNPNLDLDSPEYVGRFIGGGIKKIDLTYFEFDEEQTLSYKSSFIKKQEESFAMLEKIVKYGADLNPNTNPYHFSWLINIFTPKSGHTDFPFDYDRTLRMMKFLIDNGGDISYKDKEGHDALYYLKNSPYKIDEKYYSQFEQLLTH